MNFIQLKDCKKPLLFTYMNGLPNFYVSGIFENAPEPIHRRYITINYLFWYSGNWKINDAAVMAALKQNLSSLLGFRRVMTPNRMKKQNTNKTQHFCELPRMIYWEAWQAMKVDESAMRNCWTIYEIGEWICQRLFQPGFFSRKVWSA